MPSKSKSQARFMAAAAHNPDFAKKAGISSDAAKEWNKADAKAGTLKKGSKKPEKVTEEILDEANKGVGVINVPPSLLKQCQKYIASVLLTLAYRQYQIDVKEYDDENTEEILNGLKRFQQKYKASVISATELKKYINSAILLKLDKNQLLSELPERLRNNPAVKDSIDKMKLRLVISNQGDGSSYGHFTSGPFVSELNIFIPAKLPTKASEIDAIITGRMGTVEHELQHAIQKHVVGAVNSKSKQLEIKPDYNTDNKTAYYSSGIEYGPQVKDLINATTDELQKNTKKLTGNMAQDIKTAFNDVIKKHYKMELVRALRANKEDAAANKALKLIYKNLVSFYENELDLEAELKDFDSQERPIDSDEDGYDKRLAYPEYGETILGDMYIAIAQYFDEQPDAYGSYADLEKIVLKRPFGSVEIVKGTMHIELYVYTGDKNTSYHLSLPPKVARALVNDVNYFTSLGTVEKLRVKLEDLILPDLDIEKAYFIMDSENGNSEIFSDDDNKQVNIEFIEDDSTVYFSLKGIRGGSASNYVQIANKSAYYIGFAGGNDHEVTAKDFKNVISMIFDFYYQYPLDEVEQFVNQLDINRKITPSVVEDAMEKSKKEEVTESDMRGWMDVIQRADIDKNIDDAQNQTDITRTHQEEFSALGEDEEYDLQGKSVSPGQSSAKVHAGTSTERNEKLEEMPQRFDSFQGQDPDEFVDKTVEMTGRSNLQPFKEHDAFDVMRTKNGSGYIALDKAGKQIAIVSGFTQGKIFHVEATASKTGQRGVVYQMFMDIIDSGLNILSDTLHSDAAIGFWKKLITNHNVYVVYDGEILAKATPDKFHKYWNDDENSPSADLRLLLRK